MIDQFTYHLCDKTGDVTVHARQKILESIASVFPDVYVSEDCIIIADPSADKHDLESILLAQRCF